MKGTSTRNPKIPDLSGCSFNALTIIEDLIVERSKNKSIRYCMAKCRCGNIIKTRTNSVTSGHTQSCGCVSRRSIDMRLSIFKNRDEETLYWAGFMASDGNIHKSAVSVGLKEEDVDHLYKLKAWLGAETKIYQKPKTRSFCFRVKNKTICQDLLDYGITPNKSLTYNPPEFCCESTDFWRGMIDGDGHIGKNKPVIGLFGTEYVCSSFQNFVKAICKSKASIGKDNRNNVFSIRYHGKYAIQIMQKLYGNNPKFYLDRKYELVNKFCNFALADNSEIN